MKLNDVIVEVICRPKNSIDSRHSSIAHAINYINGMNFSLVIVQDAVRPIVPLSVS